MKEKINLLIIDPQNSFCDPSEDLYVQNSEKDMQRISSMVDRLGTRINEIYVSLDRHHFFDISHPDFWEDKEGKNPDPFTIISYKDIVDENWFPIFSSLPGYSNAKKYVEKYTKKLKENGRYSHTIWPPHCLIASHGASVVPVLYESLLRWEKLKRKNINYIPKGECITTESFSCVKSALPNAKDPSTQLKTKFISDLLLVEKILICGETSSHCLKDSVEDIVQFGDNNCIEKLCLLTDGTSPVISPFVDFPSIAKQFITDMKLKGMQVAKTTNF